MGKKIPYFKKMWNNLYLNAKFYNSWVEGRDYIIGIFILEKH